MTTNVVSLCSGIGGIDLGLERAGWTIAAQVEIDPYCQQVLTRHWPEVPRWDDLTTLDPATLPPADLVAAGFPCQPVSVAGKRLAQQDHRWLWPHVARVVAGLRPRWVLLENVPGLLGRGMGDVLGDLAALGYDAEWDCIPAAAVGAPHLRDRVWIVAHPQSVNARHRHDGPPTVFGGGPTALQAGIRAALQRPNHWAAEPDVGRVAHGVPAQMDRLHALGNAVVPQIPELIGRAILNTHNSAYDPKYVGGSVGDPS